jgi:hypothetical protein
MDVESMNQADNGSQSPIDVTSTTTFKKCKQDSNDQGLAQDEFNNATPDEKKNIVSWDGPSDPENPKNWSPIRKWLIVATTCLMTFCVTFSSSVFSATVAATAEEFNTSSEIMVLGISLFVLGFSISKLLLTRCCLLSRRFR